MAQIATNEFRSGSKVLIDGDPYAIIENEFVKPGKGQAFNRVKLRNLKTQRVIERTFKSGESLELADVTETEMQYLYREGNSFHFMAQDGTFEQYTADAEIVGEAAKWIREEDICKITLYNGSPLTVEAPNFVELEVTQTDPGVRGDTASGGAKPATLSTGAVVKVPLFIDVGDVLKIDTRTATYLNRI